MAEKRLLEVSVQGGLEGLGDWLAVGQRSEGILGSVSLGWVGWQEGEGGDMESGFHSEPV